jgi:hypothetical protein
LQEKYFDTNIEASPSSPSSVKKLNDSNCDSVTGGGNEAAGRDAVDRVGAAGRVGSNYRDNWKARQDQQNTLVFNFINSKKDVSHIENDGLDLSKRAATTAASKKVQ